MRKRTLLSRSTNIATRQRVYLIPDGLEIDEIDHFEVRRSRVFFNEVLLMTYHRYRGALFLIINGAFLLMFAVPAVLIARDSLVAGLIIGGIMAAPFLLAMLLRLIFGIDEINVYGRRSQATMRFLTRKRRARQLFAEIANAVKSSQQSFGVR